jgi:proteasome lid subunit RPN8/RPN11
MPSPRIELPSRLADQMRAQAFGAFPGECCGLLEGGRKGDDFYVVALHPASNLSSHNDRFEIDPRDQFAAQKGARLQGRAIIGCYHSHPNGRSQLSTADQAGAGEEGFVWLIVGADELGAFVYRGGKFLDADWVTSLR